jgi:hypothetical protein
LIDDFTSSQGSCGVTEALLNNASEPVADAGADFTIPVSTPFMLKGSGSDADFDVLTYSWQQLDAGTETNKTTFGTDLGDNALMRSLLPTTSSVRIFPRLGTLLAGSTDKGEVIPTTTRQINFRLVVRDGKSGMAEDDVKVTTTGLAGPFRVTSHQANATVSGGGNENITWSKAGTDLAPVNCSNVDISLLMMDASKTSYCKQDLKTVPNTGAAQVVLPDLNIPQARFMLACSDNIFFAISSGDLNVSGASTAKTDCSKIDSSTETFTQQSADVGAATTRAYPAGGIYTSDQTVVLIADESAVIYYTLNGDTPTTSSSIFTSAFVVSGIEGSKIEKKLQYFSIDSEGNTEVVRKEMYTIDRLPVGTSVPRKTGGSSGSLSTTDLGWWLLILLAGSVVQRKAMRVRAGTARR